MDAADGGTLSVTAKKRLQLPFDLAFAQTIHKSQVIFTFHSEYCVHFVLDLICTLIHGVLIMFFCHLVQGATVDRVVVDLGMSDFSDGMTYVALSRVRTFRGIAIVSAVDEDNSLPGTQVDVSWGRILQLCSSPGMRIRQAENDRLMKLAQETKQWADAAPLRHDHPLFWSLELLDTHHVYDIRSVHRILIGCASSIHFFLTLNQSGSQQRIN